MSHPIKQTMLDAKGKLRHRCQDLDPIYSQQCEKRRKHNKTDLNVTHQHGALVWGPDHTHEPPGPRGILASLRAGQPLLLDPTKISIGGSERLGQKLLSGLKNETIGFKGKFESAANGWKECPFCPGSVTRDLPGHVAEYHPEQGGLAIGTGSGGPVGMQPAAEQPELRTLPLDDWWLATAEDEIERTVPKVREYGATDLIDIGLMLARTMGRTIDIEEATELGIFFYLIGKIARWQSAIERGDRPSDDTLFDIGVYIRMAQRTRYAGSFPGEIDDSPDPLEDNPAHAPFCDGTCLNSPSANCPSNYPDVGGDPEFPRHTVYPGRTA